MLSLVYNFNVRVENKLTERILLPKRVERRGRWRKIMESFITCGLLLSINDNMTDEAGWMFEENDKTMQTLK
jgi:hypothetical protein